MGVRLEWALRVRETEAKMSKRSIIYTKQVIRKIKLNDLKKRVEVGLLSETEAAKIRRTV